MKINSGCIFEVSIRLWFLKFCHIFSRQPYSSADVTVIWVSPCFGYPHTQIPSEMGIPSKYGCRVFGIPGYSPGIPRTPVIWVPPLKCEWNFANIFQSPYCQLMCWTGSSKVFLPLGISSLRKEIEPVCLALLCMKSSPCVISVQTDLTLSRWA